MALGPGNRVGPYEIVSALGAGGMGEVYRARDTRLQRDVAIKVLPASLTSDPDRLARFEREAQVLASLNHPNIAAIHHFEHADDAPAIIMELVEGETLADRIARGPIPIDEALPIAKQVAEALEAAHEQGIIHRDLKPANIKLTPNGQVKVLDFGLAKILEAAGGGRLATGREHLSMSPTLSVHATSAGVILGTAAYMSPEQARGKVADRKADIWAFGCVLFEMLAGRQAFDSGDTVSDAIAAILKNEPDWKALPAETPSQIRTLLRRCLQKDPRKRLPHIGLARIEIDERPADTPVPAAAAAPRSRLVSDSRIAWFIAAVSVAVAIALGVTTYLSRRTVDTPVVARATILPPANTVLGVNTPGLRFTLSPDGRKLALLVRDTANRVSLWVRPIDALTAQPLVGTEGVVMATWSPDSRFLAFVSGGKLRKIDATGGSPITLADKASNLGLAWNAEDVILFSPDGGALFRVAASGGTPTQVTTPSRTTGEIGHWNPFFLPDNRHFLYVAVVGAAVAGEIGAQGIYIGSIDPMEKARMLLPSGGANPKYASGRLLFLRDATLMAQPFDADRLDLTGEAVPLAEQIEIAGATGSNGAFSVSQTGALVYQTGSEVIRSQITWYDRAGKQIGTLGEPADQMAPELSPDGSRATISVLDPTSASKNRDIWIYDVGRGLRTRFTFDPGVEIHSAWSPDGTTIAFDSRRQTRFDIYRKAASGAGTDELLLKDDRNKYVETWSPDGRLLSYARGSDSGTGNDIWTMSFGAGAKPAPFLQTPFNELRQRFSPDGRWLAYSSNESGRNEIYVTAFPGPGGKGQVSTVGGQWPRWRRDGKEIFYLSLDNKLMAVDVDATAQGFTVGSARSLFETRPRLASFGGVSAHPYDVTADGQRFLVNTLVEEASPEPLTLLLNWPALLKK